MKIEENLVGFMILIKNAKDIKSYDDHLYKTKVSLNFMCKVQRNKVKFEEFSYGKYSVSTLFFDTLSDCDDASRH